MQLEMYWLLLMQVGICCAAAPTLFMLGPTTLYNDACAEIWVSGNITGISSSGIDSSGNGSAAEAVAVAAS
jgi:hypothetical protein